MGTMVPILGPVQNLEPQNRFSGPVLPSLKIRLYGLLFPSKVLRSERSGLQSELTKVVQEPDSGVKILLL